MRRILTISLLLACFSGLAQQATIDSLKKAARESKADSTRAGALNILSELFLHANPDSALYYAETAQKLSTLSGNREQEVNAIHTIGSALYYKSDYPGALEKWKQSLLIYTDMNDDEGMATALGDIGTIYENLSDFDRSIEYTLKSLTICERIGDSLGIAQRYYTLGNVHRRSQEYQLALEKFIEANRITKALRDQYGTATTHSNIGNCYNKLGKFEEALEQFALAKALYIEMNALRGLATVDGNIGLVYNNMEKDELALEYHLKNLEQRIQLGNKNGISYAHINVAGTQLKLKKYKEAERSALNSLKYSEELGKKLGMSRSHLLLADSYEGQGNYEKALEHLKSHTVLKDSVFNEDKSKEIGKLEAKYEFEKEEEEKRRIVQEVENKIREQERRRNNLQYSGILIFLVMLGAGLLMLGRFSIPIRLAEGMIFFTFLLFFEFTLVLLDPYIEHYSGGEPAYKLLFNALLAAMIFPLHSLFEELLKKRIADNKKV